MELIKKVNEQKKIEKKDGKNSELDDYMKYYKKQLQRNVAFSKHKVFEAEVQKTVHDLNHMISQNIDVKNKKSVLDDPFLYKKAEKSKSMLNYSYNKNNNCNINNINNGDNLNYFDIPLIASNYSLKRQIKDDMWDFQYDYNNDATLKAIDKNSSYYDREKSLLKKKAIGIEKLRNNIREKELETLKEGPEMSKYSIVIMNNLQEKTKPLHKRIYEEQEKKIKIINNLKKQIKCDSEIISNINNYF